ncbi:MAG: sensor histidine kinase [Thainema sp.]
MAEEKPTRTRFLSALLKWVPSPHQHPYPTLLGGRMLSLRWYLILLVAGTLLPVVLFAVIVVYQLANQEQAASERRMLRSARTLSSTVERELSSTTHTLQALAASEQLYQGNLKGFYDEVRRVTQTEPTWLTVILISPDGQQLMNSRQPLGKPLPSVNEPASLQRLIETRQPTVGDLALGQIGQNLAFPVRVPVVHEGELQYVLTAAIAPQALADVVDEQNPVDGEWTRTIVDGQGIVVARTRDPERFVGQRGTPSFLENIGKTTEGIFRNKTLDGVKVYVAFCRVRDLPWTVAVTVPVDVIQQPTQKAMGLVIGSGLALLLVSGIGALILSRQISRSITSAALAAEALARGEHPQVSNSSIREIVVLGQSLEFAANLLSQREQERTENLMQAEAAREEAESANRVKDEFLAVLSHELRTPLNPILGWSRLLQGGKLDAARTTFALEAIERNAKLQTQLIEDLLDITRIMRGKLSLNMAPVNLVPIIESAIETVQLAAEAKSLEIETIFDQTVGPVLGDTIRLQQVVWNLLSNAVKFTDEGGRVEVKLGQIEGKSRSVGAWEREGVGEWESGRVGDNPSTRQLTFPPTSPPAYAQIIVTDTGKGIHPDFLPYVFEYFRQEDGTTTRKFGGLGLGLAIVRHLVELHGGTVQVDSPGENQGATFTVRLPLFRKEIQKF